MFVDCPRLEFLSSRFGTSLFESDERQRRYPALETEQTGSLFIHPQHFGQLSKSDIPPGTLHLPE